MQRLNIDKHVVWHLIHAMQAVSEHFIHYIVDKTVQILEDC